MPSQFFLSPAKLNLTLQVLARRQDGYHEIYTIFQKITLFDEIEVEEAPFFALRFYAEEEVPLTQNLIYRAYQLFTETFQIRTGFRVKVRKRIPMGAGLGGGSSNAGTFLRFLGTYFSIPKEELLRVARLLGADVSFFVEDYPTAEAFGIGDKLIPYPSFEAFYLILYPGFKVETAWAYRALNLQNTKKPCRPSPERLPWEDEAFFRNDFKEIIYQRYSFYSELEEILKKIGAKAVSLTGTGSAIFGVFCDPVAGPLKELKKFLKGGKIFWAKNL